MTTKVCLITGATGFIGQNIVAELVANNYKIIALGKPDESYCPTILNENNIKLTTSPIITSSTFINNDVQLLFLEISDDKSLKHVFDTCTKNDIEIEFVLHLAATATIQQALKEEERTWKTNYEGTKNILKHSLEYQKKSLNKFKGFFYASTDKVYGEGSLNTYHEDDILKPLPYPYDQSKAKADELIRKTAKEHNFPAVIYRFCNVYGPGDYHKSRIIPGTLHRLLYTNDSPILKVYHDTNGIEQSFYRDMIYIKDLTNAVKLLLNHLKTTNSNLVGEVFNLGTENTYPMIEVIEKINSYTKSSRKTKIEVVNKGEIKNQCMNYQKLNKILGFTPKYTLDKGIKETVNWYMQHKGEINEKFI